MFVAASTRTILLYGSLILTIAGFVFFAWWRTRARGARRWLPLVPTAAVLFALVWLFEHDREVIVVTDIDSGPLAERKVNLGGTGFTRAPGTSALDNPIGMETSWGRESLVAPGGAAQHPIRIRRRVHDPDSA